MGDEARGGVIETQLRAWGAELDRLRAKVDRQIAEAKQEYFEHVEELREDMEGQLRKWSAELESLKGRAGAETQTVVEQLRGKIQTELTAWGREIEGLRASASRAESEARRLVGELKARRKVLTERLGELRHASEGAWGDVRTGIAKAWEELRPALQSAASKFK